MTRLEIPESNSTVEARISEETRGDLFHVLKRGVGTGTNAFGKGIHIGVYGIRRFIGGLFGH